MIYMWFEPKSGHNAEPKLLKKCRRKVRSRQICQKHVNAAAAKHYDIDESNIRYWSKQKLVLAAMPAKKMKNETKFSKVS